MNAELTDVFLSACLSLASEMQEGEKRDRFLDKVSQVMAEGKIEDFIRENFVENKDGSRTSQTKAMSAYGETSGGALLPPSSFATRRKILTPRTLTKAISSEDKERAKVIRREVSRYADEIWDLYQDIPADADNLDPMYREFSRGMNGLHNKLSAGWQYDTIADRKKAVRELMRLSHGLSAKMSPMKVDAEDEAVLRKTVTNLRKMVLAANRMDDALSKLEQIPGVRR